MANLGSLASLPAIVVVVEVAIFAPPPAIVVVVEVAIFSSFAAAQLRPDYYASVCPNLEGIVRYSVKQSMVKSPISAPATLRLFFHDCAVMGCDASVMIISPTVDDKWRNYDDYSLKPEGFQTILDAKAAVDSDPQCRYKSGGPNYTVELGRYDGKISTRNSVMLPHVDDNLDSLNAFFYTLGLSQIDMIALSGAHTLGAADCGFFQHRTKGRDPSMNPSFDAQLQGTCARQNSAFLDDVTPVGFDNSYFQLLQKGRGLLGSDQVLYTDERSRGTVDYYSSNQGTFFYDFSVAMTKLGRVGVKTAVDGEIRRDCRYPN
uniref:Peroxidase n=1 Tax=Aegilops tauschii TaxID=37682 RepID=R7W700_AEGTA